MDEAPTGVLATNQSAWHAPAPAELRSALGTPKQEGDRRGSRG